MKFKTPYNYSEFKFKKQKFFENEIAYIKKVDELTGEISLVKNGTSNVHEKIQLERANCMELADAVEVVNGEMTPVGGIAKYIYKDTSLSPKTKAESKQIINDIALIKRDLVNKQLNNDIKAAKVASKLAADIKIKKQIGDVLLEKEVTHE